MGRQFQTGGSVDGGRDLDEQCRTRTWDVGGVGEADVERWVVIDHDPQEGRLAQVRASAQVNRAGDAGRRTDAPASLGTHDAEDRLRRLVDDEGPGDEAPSQNTFDGLDHDPTTSTRHR